MVKVLGGHVGELVETWTFQRKFGNVQRAATTTDDTEQPPAFQNFVPGRRHNQAAHRCVYVVCACGMCMWCACGALCTGFVYKAPLLSLLAGVVAAARHCCCYKVALKQ